MRRVRSLGFGVLAWPLAGGLSCWCRVAVPVARRSERQQGDDGAGGGCDQLLGGFVLVVGEVQGADHGGHVPRCWR